MPSQYVLPVLTDVARSVETDLTALNYHISALIRQLFPSKTIQKI